MSARGQASACGGAPRDDSVRTDIPLSNKIGCGDGVRSEGDNDAKLFVPYLFALRRVKGQ